MPQSLDPSPAEEPTPTPAPTPAQRPSLVKHASLQPIHDDVVPEPLPPRPVAPQQPAPDSPEPTAPAAQPAPAPEETPAAPSTPAQQPAAETTPPVVEPTAASTAPPTIETQPIAQPTAATAPVATPSPAAPFPTPPPRPNSVPTANSSVNEGLTEYEKRQTKKLTMWIIIIGAVYLLMGVLTLVISALFMRGSLLGPATLIYTLPALLFSAAYATIGIQLIRHKEFGRKGALFLSYLSLIGTAIEIIRYFINPLTAVFAFAWLGKSLLVLIMLPIIQVVILFALINFLQRKRVKAMFTR